MLEVCVKNDRDGKINGKIFRSFSHFTIYFEFVD